MKKRDRLRISDLLQKAADCICVNVPDKLILSFVGDEIWFTIETWCPALTRQCFEGEIGLSTANFRLGHQYAHMPWTAVALMMVKANFGDFVTTQVQRNASARALGLGYDGTYENLPFHRLTIDRQLFRLLDEAGVNVREAARAISAEKRHYGFFEIERKQDEKKIMVKDGDVGLPVISTWHEIGEAAFDGSDFAIRQLLPMDVALGVVGRPLGQLVDTGQPDLQTRRIALVTPVERMLFIGDDWWDTGTLITLEPDMVEIGAL